MAYDKVVDSAKLDADLTMVADAIRDTGVTDEQIAFPDGYKNEVDAILDFLLKLIGRNGEEYHGAFFPKGLKVIGNFGFSNLQRFYWPETFPEGITTIGSDAFVNAFRLYNFVLPSSLESIGNNAFGNNLNLESVTFKGTPRTIAANAFNSCSKLAAINVPWAEGAVANAPWGATNATINYNYTGEG